MDLLLEKMEPNPRITLYLYGLSSQPTQAVNRITTVTITPNLSPCYGHLVARTRCYLPQYGLLPTKVVRIIRWTLTDAENV